MARKFFGSINRVGKKCPSCREPFYNPKNPTAGVCETCEMKACSVCGKISVHGARPSNDGYPFCPKHWNSFIRFKTTGLVLEWAGDRAFKIWVENRGKHLSERMGLALNELDSELEEKLSNRAQSADPSTDEATIARESTIDKIAEDIMRGHRTPRAKDSDDE